MARLEDIQAGGANKIVRAHETDPSLVRCEFRRKDPSVRGTFLLQKIANIFFPEIVPRPVSFGQEQSTGKFYMDVERVALDAKHLRLYHPPEEANAHELEYYYKRYRDSSDEGKRIEALFEEAGFPFDSTSANFTLAENKIRHIDTSPPWLFEDPRSGHKSYDEKKLRAKIASISDPAQREEAADALREIINMENK